MKLADKPVRVHWRNRGKDFSEIPRIPFPIGRHEGCRTKSRVSRASERNTPPALGRTARRCCGRSTISTWSATLDRYWSTLSSRPQPAIGTGQRPPQPREGIQQAAHWPLPSKIPKRIPRRIPDEKYTEVFAGLRSHRDRALLAFWVATGARADELLTCKQSSASVGEQTIGVIRKGTREYQELPATRDAFVWLRLYQEEAWKKGVPRGRNQRLWWTLRLPWRPLGYDAARMMFNRANELLGANWTLHDLRHTATFLMLDDPNMPPVYVQHILGHRYLSTLDIYNRPTRDDVINAGLAHHARQQKRRENPPPAPPAPGYNTESLANLFGEHSS
ncbi:site-specific integrase [Streptomyces sp. M10(2022)]